MQWRGVRRPSVCELFAHIASSRKQMAGLRPNLHTMVRRRANIQVMLKFKVEVKGHVISQIWNFTKKIANSVFP